MGIFDDLFGTTGTFTRNTVIPGQGPDEQRTIGNLFDILDTQQGLTQNLVSDLPGDLGFERNLRADALADSSQFTGQQGDLIDLLKNFEPGTLTPEQEALINGFVQSGIDLGQSDIGAGATSSLTRIREELAPQLGLTGTGATGAPATSLLDRGALVEEEATRQGGQLIRSLQGQGFLAKLQHPLDVAKIRLPALQSSLQGALNADQLAQARAQTAFTNQRNLIGDAFGATTSTAATAGDIAGRFQADRLAQPTVNQVGTETGSKAGALGGLGQTLFGTGVGGGILGQLGITPILKNALGLGGDAAADGIFGSVGGGAQAATSGGIPGLTPSGALSRGASLAGGGGGAATAGAVGAPSSGGAAAANAASTNFLSGLSPGAASALGIGAVIGVGSLPGGPFNPTPGNNPDGSVHSQGDRFVDGQGNPVAVRGFWTRQQGDLVWTFARNGTDTVTNSGRQPNGGWVPPTGAHMLDETGQARDNVSAPQREGPGN